MNVKIVANVVECQISSVKFASSIIVRKYNIGDKGFPIVFPSITSSPNCGTELKIDSVSITPLVIPEEIPLSSIISLNKDKG